MWFFTIKFLALFFFRPHIQVKLFKLFLKYLESSAHAKRILTIHAYTVVLHRI